MNYSDISTVVSNFLETALTNDFKSIAVQGTFPEGFKARAEAAGIKAVEFNWPRTDLNLGVGLFLRPAAAEEFGSDCNLECAVAAEDDLGNWSVVTEDGRVVQFLASEVC